MHKRVMIKLLACGFFITLSLAFYALNSSFISSHQSWISHTEKEIEKSRLLNQVITNFGYGGFIHSFKNAILRQDLTYLENAQSAISKTEVALHQLLILCPEHSEDILQFSSTAAEYHQKLTQVEALITAGDSVADIDLFAKVNDDSALQALESLLESYELSAIDFVAISRRETKALQTNVQITFGLLITATLFIFGYILFINRRLSLKLHEIDLIFSGAPDGIFSVNQEGFITHANTRALDLFGYSPQALQQLRIENLLVETEPRPSSPQRAQLTSKITSPYFSAELHARKINGETFPAKISSASHTIEGTTQSIVIVKDISQEELYKIAASKDALTQLPNRRAIDSELDLAFKRFKRNHTALALCVIDIDHFKSVNDTLGHQVGDQALIELANILKDSIRKSDFIGRWGGEEFVLIMENTDQKGALELAEKLRLAVEQHFHNARFAKPLTISIGLSNCHQNDTTDSLLERADQALYRAKKNGRNNVSVI